MHPRSLVRRRPSAPIVISIAALFLSIGGVGWAATQLPAGSVGTRQLQNASVTNFKLAQESVGFRKIIPGSVGIRRIVPTQVQIRVGGKCAGASAIASITQSGGAGCVPTSPNQFGTASSGEVTVAPGNSNTTIASETLPANSPYLVFGNVSATVTAATGVTDQWVKITCTLNPGGTGNSRTAAATTHVSTANPETVDIPIVTPTGSASGSTTANVTCTFANGAGSSPTVTATASLNAITTASNS
jgi:hypothetical protein